jgi:CheY-like chemotaxis protein
VRLFWPKAEENACSLTIDLGTPGSLPVRGDPTRIKQVLGNLVSNAVKFTRKGSVSVTLGQTRSDDRVRLEFRVEDTGIGIAEADLGKLFVPFSQVGSDTSRKFGGTGLGLAISQRLAQMMGGEIQVTSRPHAGSVFRFSCLVEAGQTPADRADSRPAAMVPPKSILLAEDNPVNRQIVKLALEHRGHRVTAVENGLEAYKKAAIEAFDVILMDMQMPVMDGTAATRLLRTLPPPHGRIPVVALTADALAEHRAAYMAAGLSDFLTKPIEWNEVDAVLARLSAAPPDRAAAPAPEAEAQAGNADDDPLDRRRIGELQALMGQDGFADMIAGLDACGQRCCAQLQAALGRGDLPAVRRTAHDLKGMFANAGGTRVAEQARTLLARHDFESIRDAAGPLVSAVSATVAELRRPPAP